MVKNTDTIHNVPLLDVIQQYVKLDKRGSQFTGCCPFHDEKTPSFHVSPSKGIYKCFGCGEGGNSPVQFLMDLKGLTYPEALDEVARAGRITVEYETGRRADVVQRSQEERDRSELMRQAIQAMAEACQPYELIADTDVLDCEGKPYAGATVKRWGLGWAPGNNHMKKAGASLGISESILHDVGVLKSPDAAGASRDFFRDRLLFPILDHRGRVVAMAGRKPKSDDNPKNPKYINSPETLIYKKSEVLYGLHQNKRGITKKEFAFLVEGYTDVITLDAYGADNAIASCGTALTQQQVALLKRYTDQVVVLRDGDSAGLKAAMRDVEILIAGGIQCKVCLLPDSEDPDSFMRRHGHEGFFFYIDENEQDGFVWRVMLEWDKEDVFKKETAYQKAGELLALIKSDTLRESYIRELTKPARMGAVKGILSDAVKRAKAEQFEKKSDLTTQQETDIIEFGLYKSNNSYFVSSDPNGGTGLQISNFVVKPLLLVIGSEKSDRLVEIINQYRKAYTIVLPSESLTSLNDFKKETERYGNFRFFGKPEAYEKIKAQVYAECVDCFPVSVMGWHKEGFYVWGNGISVDGKFKMVDEYGVVEHEGVKYWLPAFSNVNASLRGDDAEESYEFEKKFRFYGEPACIDLKTWSSLMYEVHGWNGVAGMMFFAASLFRDIIFNKLSFFPHLNLFGPPGAGKSFMARSLVAMFGREIDMDPFNLSSGTPVAFKRRLAQAANAIGWYDEYSNSVDYRRVEALKGAYDGAGHERGVADGGGIRTKTTKVKSAIVVSGQEQPTQDVALFKRVVSLNYNSQSNTLEKQQAAKRLKDIEKTGQLTQITQYFLSFREQVLSTYSEIFEEFSAKVFTALTNDGMALEDRIVKNHIVLVAMAYTLQRSGVDLGFNPGELFRFLVDNMILQSEAIYNEDELSVFWRIVEFLLSNREIEHFQDLVVESRSTETFNVEAERDKKRDTPVTKKFDTPAKLIYIRFAKVHGKYQERHQRQRNKNGLDLGALQYYLKNSPAYVGYKRAKKFGNNTYSCYVFDLEQLPIEIPFSIEGGGDGTPAF
jgi:DNA primase